MVADGAIEFVPSARTFVGIVGTRYFYLLHEAAIPPGGIAATACAGGLTAAMMRHEWQRKCCGSGGTRDLLFDRCRELNANVDSGSSLYYSICYLRHSI